MNFLQTYSDILRTKLKKPYAFTQNQIEKKYSKKKFFICS